MGDTGKDKGKSRQEPSEINKRLEKIVKSLDRFNTCCSIAGFGSLLLESVARNMLAEGGSLYIIKDDALVLSNSLDPGHAPEIIRFPLRENSPFDKALKTGKPQIFRDIRKTRDITTSGYTGYGNSTALIFPVTEDGTEIRGLLSLHAKNPPPFTKLDLQIGKIFMAQSCETLRYLSALKELEEKEEMFRAVFSSVRAGIIIVDKQSGLVTDINSAAGAITGIDEKKAASRHYSESFSSLFPESAEKRGPGGKVKDMPETTISRPDGTRAEVIKSISSFTAGGRQYLASAFLDVTDIENTRIKLESRYNFYQSIINTAHVIILLLDKSGKIVFANPYITELTGKNQESYIGQLWTESLVPENDSAESEKLFLSSLKGNLNSFTGRVVSGTGEILTVMWFNSAVKAKKGSMAGLLMIGQDITQQVRIEQRLWQAEKMEAIGQLSGALAHDFNNQLAGIMGYAEILREELDGDRVLGSYIEKIITSARNASGITSQLLAYARKGKYQVGPVNISKVINDVVESLQKIISSSIITRIKLNALQHTATGDETQLFNAFFNLAINSAEAVSSGGAIEFRTDNIILGSSVIAEKNLHCEPGLYLHVSISDNGEGMEMENAEKIFEPFFATGKRGKNPGLGLSSVYGTIVNHNGFIEFTSTPGDGSVFEIYLPVSENSLSQN